jgi:hypothetical protein
MTSEEIKAFPANDKSLSSWLKEVAYQLAVLNEKTPPAKQQPAQQPRR